MTLTPDVAAGTLIQSAWGNEIRDRTVQRFATIAERNAQYTAPAVGAVCTVTGAGLYIHNGTKWVGQTRGRIAAGWNATTVDASSNDTITSVAFSLPEARLLRIEASVEASQISTSSTVANLQFVLNGAVPSYPFLYNRSGNTLALNEVFTVHGAWVTSGVAGANTAAIRGTTASSALRIPATAGFVNVYDLGTP